MSDTEQPPQEKPPRRWLRRELEATLGAREQLGPRYDSELIESFLERLERALGERTVAPPARPPSKALSSVTPARLLFALVVVGVPLLAFSASFGAFLGLFFGVGFHSVLIGLISFALGTLGSFAAVSVVLAVIALIYLDRRR